MKRCILCGEFSQGSIGRASGLHYKLICPPCRAREDREIDARVRAETEGYKLLDGVAK